MANDKIWLSSPHMGGHEQKYIQQAFDENWIAPLGPNVTGFEKDLETYLGNEKKVAALSAGTAAIHLGLIMANVQAGDFVICQSLTFSASANPILYQGANPVFVDSEVDTWNMDPASLKVAIEGTIQKHGVKPKAIVAVHLYGMPYKHKEIQEIALRYDIPIIEDAAEALGSHYHNQFCGTLGDFGVLSFNGNKIITTSGGGALVVNTKEEKDRVIYLSTQAREIAVHYQHVEVGYNYRMSNITAGIGRGQMEVLNDRVNSRRSNFEYYKKHISSIQGIEFCNEPEGHYSNRWLTAILIHTEKTGFSREDLRIALEKENIESRPLWKPMHLQPVFEKYDYYGEKVAEELFNIGLCLPSGSNLTETQLQRIVNNIHELNNGK
ncbi:MAG: DegT/DnrJ/EryC1/StrS family aminotransferase [Brumimicrobium sp.]|nr:DegT/DnrJ/EryC1/StrS family aminotransferase [Brumimicrobium sp.]